MSHNKRLLRKNVLVAFGALLFFKVGFIAWPYISGENPVAPATAHAQTAPAAPAPAADNPETPPAPVIKEPAPGELDLEIIKDVERRQKELAIKEEELKRKEERLRTMQSDMDKQISELQALQAKIEDQIKLRSDLEKTAVTKLAKTYSAMPPENAAALIQKIDTAIAIRVLSSMKERSAGRILAVLPPDLATRLSEGLVRKR